MLHYHIFSYTKAHNTVQFLGRRKTVSEIIHWSQQLQDSGDILSA